MLFRSRTLMENKADKSAQAQEKMNRMKYEIANELGIDLKQGYNGDLTSKQAGYIGGYMVKKMIEDVERKNSSK
mgnify:CR=1 FL=1